MSDCRFLTAVQRRFHRALPVLASHRQRQFGSGYQLSELVRKCDVEWVRATGEQPYFEIASSRSQTDDPYALEGVRSA